MGLLSVSCRAVCRDWDLFAVVYPSSIYAIFSFCTAGGCVCLPGAVSAEFAVVCTNGVFDPVALERKQSRAESDLDWISVFSVHRIDADVLRQNIGCRRFVDEYAGHAVWVLDVFGGRAADCLLFVETAGKTDNGKRCFGGVPSACL